MNMSITPHEASPISYIKHYYNTNKRLIDMFVPKPAPIVPPKMSTRTTQTAAAYSK